jgi:hypothetical protein
MKRRTKGVLLVGSLATLTVVAAVVVMTGLLTTAFARIVDPHNYCETGFSTLVDCTYHWTTTSISQGTPAFTTPSSTPPRFQPSYTDTMTWAVAKCPQDYIARRLLCAVAADAAPVQAASDDLATGLPRPKPWFITTARNSRFIEALHVETPLDLAATLAFYRAELSKRGWTEDDGAVVAPDGAMIAFTTSGAPALLRLTRQDDRTIVDLSTRKRAATNVDSLPKPGQARLLLGNATDEEAVITINEQTMKFAARAGDNMNDDPETGRKSPGSREIKLPPGKHKVALKIASGAVQNREFEVAAGETWGLLAGPAGVLLPVHLY